MGFVNRGWAGECRKQQQIRTSATSGLAAAQHRSFPPPTCSPPVWCTGAASLCTGGSVTETFRQTAACSILKTRIRGCIFCPREAEQLGYPPYLSSALLSPQGAALLGGEPGPPPLTCARGDRPCRSRRRPTPRPLRHPRGRAARGPPGSGVERGGGGGDGVASPAG